MKLGFILPAVCIAGKGGVPVQARMWKEGLENNGDQVEMISPWGEYDWETFDYIIVFGIGELLLGYVSLLRQYPNIKLVCAPIIDFPKSLKEFRFRARFFGSVKFKVNRPLHDLYYSCKYFDFFLARSEHEKRYIVEGLGVDANKVEIVPLINTPNKEPSTFPTPPVRSVPPMTAEEIASISRPVAWVVVPAMVFRQ